MSLCYSLYYINRKTEILNVTFLWSESRGYGNVSDLKLLYSSTLSVASMRLHNSVFSHRGRSDQGNPLLNLESYQFYPH